MTSNEEMQIVLKLLLLGDSSVGKTSILLKYIQDKFDESSSISTIGVDYMDKIIDYNNFKIKLQIWDTSGEEKFRTITKNFYRNADGLLVVYDLTRKETYDHIKIWLNEAKEYNSNIKTVLLGNKLDRENEREVLNKVATDYANKNNLKYLETSAKDGTNIKESFFAVIDLLLNGKSEKEILNEYTKEDSALSIASDNNVERKKKKACC